MDFLHSILAPTGSNSDIITDLYTWDLDFLSSEIFNLTFRILKQADLTIENIYDSYYSPPIIDYSCMDTSKEVTVGCNGWGNQQLWTLPWLLK